MLTGYKLKELSRLFAPKMQAIAHPHRLAILHCLAHKPLPFSELVSNLDIPENLVSHHLKTLHTTGWISKRTVGRETTYTLKEKGFFELFRMLEGTPFYRTTILPKMK